MAQTVYTFDEATIRRIAAAVRDHERRTVAQPQFQQRRFPRSIAGSALYGYTCTENFGATTTGLASATIYSLDGAGSTSFGTDTVYDPMGIFAGEGDTQDGYCIKQGGKYYAIQLGCS